MNPPAEIESPPQIYASTPAPLEPWALTHLPSHFRLWAAAVIGLAADLWTKDWAFRELAWGRTRALVPDLCGLQLSLNPGALFGIGAGLAPIFVGASVLALLFVLYLFANSTTSRWSMHLALGLVLAGALGNLYDRATQNAYMVRYPGGGQVVGKLISESPRGVVIGDYPGGANPRTYDKPAGARAGLQPVVRDFIKIELKIAGRSLWPWIFNIADALLVVGVGMLLLNFWFERAPEGSARPSTTSVG